MGTGVARNVPQNALEKLLGGAGRGIGSVRNFLNKNAGIPFVDTGLGLGDMMLGEGPEMLDEMSWGKSPIIGSGMASRIDPRIMDVIDAVGLTGVAGMGAKAFGKAGLKDMIKQHPPSQAQGGYIMGERSKLADLKKLDDARLRRDAGENKDQVYRDTGWWLDHPDGRPRFEVEHGDEDLAGIGKLMHERDKLNAMDRIDMDLPDLERRSALRMLLQDDGLMKDRVTNSPVAEHYPGYDKLQFKREPWDSGYEGTYWKPENGSPGKIQLRHTGDAGADKRTMQHETQHHIAEEEGFSPGGNPGMIAEYLKTAGANVIDHYEEMVEQGYKLGSDEKLWIKDAKRDIRMFNDNLAFGPYQALMDEAQARLVESRSHLLKGQMMDDPFYRNYPVSLNKMIDWQKVEGKHTHQDYLDTRKRIMQNVK